MPHLTDPAGHHPEDTGGFGPFDPATDPHLAADPAADARRQWQQADDAVRSDLAEMADDLGEWTDGSGLSEVTADSSSPVAEGILPYDAGLLNATTQPRGVALPVTHAAWAVGRRSTLLVDASPSAASRGASHRTRVAPITMPLRDSSPSASLHRSSLGDERRQGVPGTPRAPWQRVLFLWFVAGLAVFVCFSCLGVLVWRIIWPPSGGGPSRLGLSGGMATVSADGTPIASRISGTAPTTTPVSATATVPAASPYAKSATVTFKRASATEATHGTMTACPTGCDLSTSSATVSQAKSTSAKTTGQNGYYAVDLEITTLLGTTGNGWFSPIGFIPTTFPNAGIVACTNGNQGSWWISNLAPGSTIWIQCVPSKHPVPAQAFSNVESLSQSGSVSYQNPNGSYWQVTSWYVTQADCTAVKASAATAALTWENNYTQSGPLIKTSTWTDTPACSPGVGTISTTVTGSAMGHVTVETFAPSSATTLAGQRLDALLPSHDQWQSTTRCTPTWTTSGTTFTITCQETGVAIYAWGTSDTNSLQAHLAGLSLAQAQQVCAGTTGVSGACTIALSDGTRLPQSPDAIVVQVQ